MRKYSLTVLLLFLICLLACKYFSKKERKEVVRDTTITIQTSFNNLFLDSVELEIFLQKNPIFQIYEKQYLDFYRQRNFEFAWFDSSGLAEQSHNFINLLNSSIEKFQDSSLYNDKLYKFYQLSSENSLMQEDRQSLITTELLFTGQFFIYAAKVYKGSDINASDLGWFIPRKKVNLTALLDSAIKAKAQEDKQYVPINPQYEHLQNFLVKYYEMDKLYTKDTIAYPSKPFKKGDSTKALVLIKQKLYVTGDLKIADTTPKFDTALLHAVKRYQRRMGLLVDGSVGIQLIKELNITIQQRIQQILVNMERARWMPAEPDSNYILVNIPEYKMHVFDSGRLAFDMNVIVGTSTNSTVIFNGNLKYIVFSPYWNVPVSIVKKEIVPALQKDKNYLQKNNMEVTGKSNGLPVVRQKPGNNNSLGLVKFLFPNNYDIYFHDTPNRDLFSAANRSFSHGCIRIGEPKKFAQYLLRADTATIWKSKTIDSCMHLKTEKWVTLKKSVPVFIVYFTSWVDKNGVLNFRKDIYGHDTKMSEKLFVKK